MMTFDPFQNYSSALGPHYGMTAPFGLPHNVPQASVAPTFGIPQAGFPQPGISQQIGQPNYGGLQAQGGLAQNPALQALQNPLLAVAVQTILQNPWLAAVLQNPSIVAGLQNSPLNPVQYGSQQQSPYYPQIGQPGLPYGQQQQQLGSPWQQQLGSPFGQGLPLAPQSWVGQPGLLGAGQPFGQVHPLLSQLGVRPWAG